MRNYLLSGLLLCGFLGAATSFAKEPGWSGPIIARGAQREQIESMDILDRPYRPLHFYGNAVRRQHYRGRALPSIRETDRGSAASGVRP
ncbi:MAG: hypothetical protein ACYC6N_28000 [Pirellulaceae bacterium]